MAANGRKLRLAFAQKEETQDFLSNLEKLKEGGSIAEEQYEMMRDEYQQRLASIESEIVAIKNDLSRELVNSKRELGAYKAEVEKLGTRHKVGEIPLEQYTRLDQRARRKIDRIESWIAQLETLISAKSSADVGVVARRPEFALPQVSSLTQFVSSPEELITPPTRLLGPVAGLILFISVFLTWMSADWGWVTESVSGIDDHSLIGVAGIICGLIIGVGAAFLAQARARGLLQIGAGVVALIVFLAAFVPHWVSDASDVADLGGAFSIGAGVYLNLVAIVALTVSGVLELRAR